MLIYLAMLETEQDKSLFETLYDNNYQKMLKTARAILKNFHAAEDAVHDAFLKIVNNIEMFYPEKCHNPEGLCVTIVRNISISIYRKEIKVTVEPYEDYHSVPGSELPDELVASYERHMELIDALRRLEETNRIVIELKFVYNFSNNEIAKMLDISEDAVRKRIQRGRQKLREEFGVEGAING